MCGDQYVGETLTLFINEHINNIIKGSIMGSRIANHIAEPAHSKMGLNKNITLHKHQNLFEQKLKDACYIPASKVY